MNRYVRYIVITACVLYALGKLTYDLGKLAGSWYYANRHIVDPKIKAVATTTIKYTIRTAQFAHKVITSERVKSAAFWCRNAIEYHIRAQLGDLAPRVGKFLNYSQDEVQTIAVMTLKDQYGNFFKARQALSQPAARSWSDLLQI